MIWDEVCEVAGVEGKTPHLARRAMGKHIIEKTRNIAAVQRQLGHKLLERPQVSHAISGENASQVSSTVLRIFLNKWFGTCPVRLYEADQPSPLSIAPFEFTYLPIEDAVLVTRFPNHSYS